MEMMAEICEAGFYPMPPNLPISQFDFNSFQPGPEYELIDTQGTSQAQTYTFNKHCYKIPEKGNFRDAPNSEHACLEQNCLRCGNPIDRDFMIWAHGSSNSCAVCKVNHQQFGPGVSQVNTYHTVEERNQPLWYFKARNCDQ